MKKWLPYIVAAVLGLGVAAVAFGPGLGGGKDKTAKEEKAAKKKLDVAVDMGADGTSVARLEGTEKTPKEIVAEARANPIPPPGTLRPLNQAEIEHKAKLERPFNKHYAYVAAFWNQTARLIGSTDAALSKEASQMNRFLRDQGNMDESELDVAAAIAKEKELVARIRAARPDDEQLKGVLDYIEESGQAVLDGKDPTQVLKPSQKKAAGG